VATEGGHAAVRREADLLIADARRAVSQPADLATVEAAYTAIAR
jgi:uncharacterized membrane protein